MKPVSYTRIAVAENFSLVSNLALVTSFLLIFAGSIGHWIAPIVASRRLKTCHRNFKYPPVKFEIWKIVHFFDSTTFYFGFNRRGVFLVSFLKHSEVIKYTCPINRYMRRFNQKIIVCLNKLPQPFKHKLCNN